MTDTVPDNDGQWLSTTVAAAHLGVTERTLQRHIVAGRYRVDRKDGKVHVWLPTAVAHVPDDLSVNVGQLSDTMSELSATVGHALTLLAEERTRAADAEARASQAEQAAAMWQERARGLEAQLALPPPIRRPWWQWWRRG